MEYNFCKSKTFTHNFSGVCKQQRRRPHSMIRTFIIRSLKGFISKHAACEFQFYR